MIASVTVTSNIAPCLLVAAPELQGAPFRKSVVLLVELNDEGALGFIVNRPARMSFAAVLKEVGVEFDKDALPAVSVIEGGPVSPGSGWIVFRPDGTDVGEEDCIEVSDDISVSASLDTLQVLSQGNGPRDRLLALGYAGWSAGQLEEEIRAGSWIPVSLSASVLFETPVEERWQRALANDGIDPARLAMRQVAEA